MRSLSFLKLLTIVSGCAALLLSGPAAAMRVTPTVFDMSASGSGARKTISVTSTEAMPLPVELVITAVDLDPDGKQIKLGSGDDDLLIFPPQAVIPPGATQVFRVQWIGDPGLAASRSYSISVNQVPVEVPMPAAERNKIRAAVQVVLNFAIFATVRPAKGASAFKVQSAKIVPSTTAPNKSEVALTIENSGNVHDYLCNAVLTLRAGRWSKRLAPSDVLNILGPGLVLPRHTRKFALKLDDLPRRARAISANIDMGRRTGLPY